MTREEKSVLLALALGDGHIKKNQPELIVFHYEAQKELVIWKHQLVKNILGYCGDIVTKTIGPYKSYGFHVTHKYFKVLRRYLYKNGVKHYSTALLNRLGPLGIAIWHMDDGSLYAKKRNGKVHAYELVISTYCSWEESWTIINWFKKTHEIEMTQKFNKDKFCVRTGTNGARRFSALVREFVIPSMEYKLLS